MKKTGMFIFTVLFRVAVSQSGWNGRRGKGIPGAGTGASLSPAPAGLQLQLRALVQPARAPAPAFWF